MVGAVDVDGNVQVVVRYEDRLEWNAVLDPEAFREVFATSVTLRLVPLDATQDVPVPGDLRRRLQAKQAAPAPRSWLTCSMGGPNGPPVRASSSGTSWPRWR